MAQCKLQWYVLQDQKNKRKDIKNIEPWPAGTCHMDKKLSGKGWNLQHRSPSSLHFYCSWLPHAEGYQASCYELFLVLSHLVLSSDSTQVTWCRQCHSRYENVQDQAALVLQIKYIVTMIRKAQQKHLTFTFKFIVPFNKWWSQGAQGGAAPNIPEVAWGHEEDFLWPPTICGMRTLVRVISITVGEHLVLCYLQEMKTQFRWHDYQRTWKTNETKNIYVQNTHHFEVSSGTIFPTWWPEYEHTHGTMVVH
jgi:hypothetical protein